MKSWINRLFILTVCSLALWSCEKDEDRITITGEGEPVLTASATTLELVRANADEQAVIFSWTPYNLTWSNNEYSHDNAVKYTLQVDVAGNEFADPQTVILNNGAEKAFTVKELNAVLTKLELQPETPAEVEFRLVTRLGDNIPPIYSNTQTLTITPYLDVPVYPSLYVPGSHQGWAPDAAPRISSPEDNGTYEGYVNFESDAQFKFTSEPNWNGTNYGYESDTKLSSDGGAGNLFVPEAGYYLLEANTETMTWSATKTTWGVIGSATAGGWDSDQDLTYDAATGTWKGTFTLNNGELKFRANDAWNIDYGDDDVAGSEVLKRGGGNIQITQPGTYEVTLNLSNPAYYFYSIEML